MEALYEVDLVPGMRLFAVLLVPILVHAKMGKRSDPRSMGRHRTRRLFIAPRLAFRLDALPTPINVLPVEIVYMTGVSGLAYQERSAVSPCQVILTTHQRILQALPLQLILYLERSCLAQIHVGLGYESVSKAELSGESVSRTEVSGL